VNDSLTSSERVLKFVPAAAAPRFYEFGPFRLDALERQLYRDGETISLTPKSIELLVLLVERHGQIVDKETVMAALWPETFVEESNLTQHVFRLRKVLGNGSEANGYIETIPRRGYRFIAPLVPATAPQARMRRRWFVAAALLLAAIVAALSFRAPERSISTEAQEAYLKGRHFWNRRTLPDFEKAIEHFRTAVELDPRYAVAWAGLADAYNFAGQPARARVAAKRALEIDGTLADAHATLGNSSTFNDFDFPAGAAHLRRAIALKPGYATAHQWLAFNLAAQGRFDEALVSINRARQLDPTSLIMNTDVGTILYFARRYDESIAATQRALELDPSFRQAYNVLGLAYLRKGKLDEAAAAFARVNSASVALARVHIVAGRGRREEARRSLSDVEANVAAMTEISPYMLAQGAVAAGDSDEALALIESAYQQRDSQMTMIAVDPAVDALRADPRFQRVLTRMRLR
jgi:DNA-binding winged helix-turn-helix (wHTH) protein/Tfp pilus assembly protein PilF